MNEDNKNDLLDKQDIDLNDASKNKHTIQDENELKDDTYRLANQCENIDLKDIHLKWYKTEIHINLKLPSYQY